MAVSFLAKLMKAARSNRTRLMIDKGCGDSTFSNDSAGVAYGAEFASQSMGLPVFGVHGGMNDTQSVQGWTTVNWGRRASAVTGAAAAPNQTTTDFRRVKAKPSGWSGQDGVYLCSGTLKTTILIGAGAAGTFDVDVDATADAQLPTAAATYKIKNEYFSCTRAAAVAGVSTFTIVSRAQWTSADGVAAVEHVAGENVGHALWASTPGLWFARKFAGGMQGNLIGSAWYFKHKESEQVVAVSVPSATDAGFTLGFVATSDDAGTPTGANLASATRVRTLATTPDGALARADVVLDSPTVSSSVSLYLCNGHPIAGPAAIPACAVNWVDRPYGVGYAFEDHQGSKALQEYLKESVETAGNALRLQDRMLMLYQMVSVSALGATSVGDVVRLTMFSGFNSHGRTSNTALVNPSYAWTIANTDGLTAGINDSDTTIPVGNCAMLNAAGGVMKIGSEYITYTGRSAASGAGNATGGTRGTHGTTAAAHLAGVAVYHGYVTATKLGEKTNLLYEDIRLRAAFLAANGSGAVQKFRHAVVTGLSISDAPAASAGADASATYAERQYRNLEYLAAANELAAERNAELGFEAMGVCDLLSPVTAADLTELRDTPSDGIHHLAGGYVLAWSERFRLDQSLLYPKREPRGRSSRAA